MVKSTGRCKSALRCINTNGHHMLAAKALQLHRTPFKKSFFCKNAFLFFFFHMTFGSQELISPFLFAPSCWAWESIKEVLRLPEMYVSEHIRLTDLSLLSMCAAVVATCLSQLRSVQAPCTLFSLDWKTLRKQTPKCLFRNFQVIHMFMCFSTDRICLGHEGKYTIYISQ